MQTTVQQLRGTDSQPATRAEPLPQNLASGYPVPADWSTIGQSDADRPQALLAHSTVFIENPRVYLEKRVQEQQDRLRTEGMNADPGAVVLLHRMAQCLADLKRNPQAEALFTKAIASDPALVSWGVNPELKALTALSAADAQRAAFTTLGLMYTQARLALQDESYTASSINKLTSIDAAAALTGFAAKNVLIRILLHNQTLLLCSDLERAFLRGSLAPFLQTVNASPWEQRIDAVNVLRRVASQGRAWSEMLGLEPSAPFAAAELSEAQKRVLLKAVHALHDRPVPMRFLKPSEQGWFNTYCCCGYSPEAQAVPYAEVGARARSNASARSLLETKLDPAQYLSVIDNCGAAKDSALQPHIAALIEVYGSSRRGDDALIERLGELAEKAGYDHRSAMVLSAVLCHEKILSYSRYHEPSERQKLDTRLGEALARWDREEVRTFAVPLLALKREDLDLGLDQVKRLMRNQQAHCDLLKEIFQAPQALADPELRFTIGRALLPLLPASEQAVIGKETAGLASAISAQPGKLTSLESAKWFTGSAAQIIAKFGTPVQAAALMRRLTDIRNCDRDTSPWANTSNWGVDDDQLHTIRRDALLPLLDRLVSEHPEPKEFQREFGRYFDIGVGFKTAKDSPSEQRLNPILLAEQAGKYLLHLDGALPAMLQQILKDASQTDGRRDWKLEHAVHAFSAVVQAAETRDLSGVICADLLSIFTSPPSAQDRMPREIIKLAEEALVKIGLKTEKELEAVWLRCFEETGYSGTDEKWNLPAFKKYLQSAKAVLYAAGIAHPQALSAWLTLKLQTALDRPFDSLAPDRGILVQCLLVDLTKSLCPVIPELSPAIDQGRMTLGVLFEQLH